MPAMLGRVLEATVVDKKRTSLDSFELVDLHEKVDPAVQVCVHSIVSLLSGCWSS